MSVEYESFKLRWILLG